MIKKIAPSVQAVNAFAREESLASLGVNWSDLRYLVEVQEGGSLRAAARRIEVSVNTVRAHLQRLEHAIGEPVLRRDLTGAKLTTTGLRLYESAAKLNSARLSSERVPNGLIQPSTLSFGCTEGIGTSWLTPRLADLARRVAPITIDIKYDYDLQKDRSSQVDLGLTYQPSLSSDIVAAKLATMHFLFFASPAYLAQRGTPRSIEELRGHSFVEQVASGYNNSALDLVLGADRPSSGTCIRTNSSMTQAYAVANGAGIAFLPSYARAITSALVPVPVLPHFRIPIYYYYHVEARRCGIVREAIDWLKEAFDPKQYPWFADTFVHPEDFPHAVVRQSRVVSMFQHFMDHVVR